MKTAMIRVRVDKEIQDEATKIFSELGLSLSAAVRMYLHHVINQHKKKES